MYSLYNNIDAVFNLASTGVLGEVKHILQQLALLHSAKFVIRGFNDLEKILFSPHILSEDVTEIFFFSLNITDTIKMARNDQDLSVKEGGYFRACHDSLTDQNGYVDDSSVVNALPLKDAGT